MFGVEGLEFSLGFKLQASRFRVDLLFYYLTPATQSDSSADFFGLHYVYSALNLY